MRHNKKINHLGRTNTHRDAMLSNMACSLIKHKRIFTTVAKAKKATKTRRSRKKSTAAETEAPVAETPATEEKAAE